jgi:hypothetical protein
MRTRSLDLRIGQKLRVQVVEILAADALIVMNEGQLLRVTNESGMRFRPGQQITMFVRGLDPLQFQIQVYLPDRLDRFA